MPTTTALAVLLPHFWQTTQYKRECYLEKTVFWPILFLVFNRRRRLQDAMNLGVYCLAVGIGMC